MEAPSVAPPKSGGSSGLEVWQVLVPAMIAVVLAVCDVVLVVFLLIRWRRRRSSGEGLRKRNGRGSNKERQYFIGSSTVTCLNHSLYPQQLFMSNIHVLRAHTNEYSCNINKRLL